MCLLEHIEKHSSLTKHYRNQETMCAYPYRRFACFNFFLLMASSFGHFTLFACRSRDYVSKVSWADKNLVATRYQKLILTALVRP